MVVNKLYLVKNSTFNGTTIADLGTVTTATINGGNIDGTVIGATSAAAGSFAAIVGTSLSVSDGNITNVGSIACDSVVVDDASAGLDIVFGGNTTTNKISLTDNLADALNINQGGNSYMKFTTTNGSEQIVFGKGSTFSGTTIANLGTVTTATINGGNIDGTVIGATSAAAGSFAAIVGTSLSVSDGNITNVGNIALDSISADDGSSFSFGNNWTAAGRTCANLGTVTTATSITTDALVATTADINGGSIDGVVISANSANTGAFTTITASTSLDVTGSGGIIFENDETITNSTNGTVLINGELAAGTGSAPGIFKSNGNYDVTLKTGNSTSGVITIIDGPDGNIDLLPNGSGKVFTEKIDINGGTIDGTTIGASSASTGKFTSLNVDDIVLDGKVITMTGDTDDTAVFTAGTNGALSIVTTDTAGAAANISITADGTAELAGTTVTLNSSGGITLDADNGTITFSDNGASLGTITSSGYTGNVVGDISGNAAQLLK